MIWSKKNLDHDTSAAESLLVSIREYSAGLGLHRLGIADPARRPEPEALDGWLARGFQAEMTYLERHRDLRLDPALFFPGVKSILCVAVSYKTTQPGLGSQPGDSLRISHFAQGVDYHRILKNRLHLLLAEIKARVPKTKGKVAVDTAPVLERHWAEQAGIGWIGRNGCLIVPGLGSWLFLGELFLDIPLPFGRPMPRRCGDCRRCLSACPTEALTEQNGLDARACISYWTVEHRGEFTEETPPLSPWLFGCDICQEACPWNAKVSTISDAEFESKLIDLPGIPVSVEEWAFLPQETFDRELRSTSMERTGCAGLRRNARRLLNERLERTPAKKN